MVAERAPAHTLLPEEFSWRSRLEALTRDIDAALRPEMPPDVLEAARGLHSRPKESEDLIHTELTKALQRLAVLKRYGRASPSIRTPSRINSLTPVP